MSVAFAMVLAFVGVALVFPCAILFIECIAALFPERSTPKQEPANEPARVVVLIPAYDEAREIERTLGVVFAELGPADRVLVIADNCTDGTAEIARRAGAEVLERYAPAHRGKGFALDAGIAHLAADPPDVVVVLDADCRVDPGSIKKLANCAVSQRLPVQAEDLLIVPEHATPLALISALAFMVRNHVRPTGLKRLSLPCHLMGTGMAFPWDVICNAPPAGSHLTEDIQMGIELASLGFPPVFCPGARITSASPKRASAARGQRRRWEHGHISTLLHRAPKLIWRGISSQQATILAMGLDLVVPPLALLVVLLGAGFLASLVLALFTDLTLPLTLFAGALVLVLAAVMASWAKFGRKTFPARYLFMVPFYIAWKIPLYLSFAMRGPYATWERAERSASGF